MIIEIKKGERIMTFYELLAITRESVDITVYKEYKRGSFRATMTAGEWRSQKTPSLLLSIVSEISVEINGFKVVLERR
jgi:hypothetical protein